MENDKNRESIDISIPQLAASTVTLDRGLKDKEDAYNPYEHRVVENPTSTWGAFFHVMKSSVGAGVLSMSAATRRAGLVPAAVGTPLIAALATHCVHVLVQTSTALCVETRTPSLGFADTCSEAFRCGPRRLKPLAPIVRTLADFMMAGVCLGGTSVYVLFISSSVKDVLEATGALGEHAVSAYSAALLVPLAALNQARSLRVLAPLSAAADACLLAALAVAAYFLAADDKLYDAKPRDLLAPLAGWPMYLSTAIFAMEGINVIMPVENEMSNPKQFLAPCGVLNGAMTVAAILYTVAGVAGYWRYGDQVQSNMILNLPQDNKLALAAKALVALAVFCTYFLQMYAPMEIIWGRLRPRVAPPYRAAAQVLLRVLSVVFTVILAVAIPDLEALMGLVAAIFFSTLGILFPIVVETVFRWERGLGPYKCILWKNTLLMLFYLLALISGCYSAISELVK